MYKFRQIKVIIFDVVYGSVIVVVILEETVRFDEHISHLLLLNMFLFDKDGENIPNALRDV